VVDGAAVGSDCVLLSVEAGKNVVAVPVAPLAVGEARTEAPAAAFGDAAVTVCTVNCAVPFNDPAPFPVAVRILGDGAAFAGMDNARRAGIGVVPTKVTDGLKSVGTDSFSSVSAADDAAVFFRLGGTFAAVYSSPLNTLSAYGSVFLRSRTSC
jgi:hypothetical protein